MSPDDVGLPLDLTPRRVPGLRREEVASLAGVSLDYYVKLERGRTRGVSRPVWESLARSLRLDDVERAYLLDLVDAEAGMRPRDARFPAQRVSDRMTDLLHALGDVPAMVQGRRTEVLAFNDMFRHLYVGFADRYPAERNVARFILLDPAAKRLYAEWERVAREVSSALRLYVGSHPNDPQVGPLVEELSQEAVFRRVWSEHSVVRHAHGEKKFTHPVVGALTLNYQTFQDTDDPDQTLVMFHATPGSPSDDALQLLGTHQLSEA